MNELVNDDTGILVNTIGSEKHGLGKRFFIDQKDDFFLEVAHFERDLERYHPNR